MDGQTLPEYCLVVIKPAKGEEKSTDKSDDGNDGC